ncbi:mitochondrial ubiquitin ligase activator of NFKB 1-like [Glandiceps talaboti]
MFTDFLVVGCGTAATALTWYLCRGKQQSIDTIKAAPTLKIDANLKNIIGEAPNQSLPYVAIEGEAKPIGQTLKSEYVAGMVGLIQTLIVKEHKTEWSKSTRVWQDTDRFIQNTTRHVPFCLEGEQASVDVDQPLDASGLNLETIYDKFAPIEASLGQSIVNWATGEKTKGYEEIEKILPVGTMLTGLGKLTLENERLQLGPPTEQGDYMLSTLSRSQIVKGMDARLRIWKTFMYIFGATTAIITLAYLWKWVKKYRERRIMQQQMEEFRQHQRRGATEGEDNENPNASVCVVCLTNPREVVILNCGHICACSNCVEALRPPHCPICRQRIARTIPVFHP